MADYDQQSIINGLLPPPTNPAVNLSQGFLAGAKKAPGAVADALGLPDALKALRGQMTDQEQQDLAAGGLAGLLGPVGKGAAIGKAIFAGMGAKTANLAKLSKAQEMWAEGQKSLGSPYPSVEEARRRTMQDSIWNESGWFRGVDGKWRFEIPDTGSKINRESYEGYTLGGKLEHPELYAAYPSLHNIETQYNKLPKHASYRAGPPERISLPEELNSLNEFVPFSPKKERDTILHEIQHAVQRREDFAPGANSESLLPLAKAEGEKHGSPKSAYEIAHEAYKRFAGETEARNVELRSILNPERLKIAPYRMMDYPPQKQIIPSEWFNRQTPEIQQYIRALQGK